MCCRLHTSRRLKPHGSKLPKDILVPAQGEAQCGRSPRGLRSCHAAWLPDQERCQLCVRPHSHRHLAGGVPQFGGHRHILDLIDVALGPCLSFRLPSAKFWVPLSGPYLLIEQFYCKIEPCLASAATVQVQACVWQCKVKNVVYVSDGDTGPTAFFQQHSLAITDCYRRQFPASAAAAVNDGDRCGDRWQGMSRRDECCCCRR